MNSRSQLQVQGNKDAFTLRLPKQSEPVMVRLSTSETKSPEKGKDGYHNSTPAPKLFFVLYKSDLVVSGTAGDVFLAMVKGDKENDDYEKYRKQDRALDKKSWELMKQLLKLDPEKDSVRHQAVLAEMKANSKRRRRAQEDFMQKYPASFTSLVLLDGLKGVLASDKFEEQYNKLSNDYKYTSLAKTIEQRIEYLSPVKEGKTSVSFVKKDKDGKEINLDSYKGRVVLLDFWGSWCGFCREAHPHLKEVYAKYKEKGFEIIGIANEVVKTPEEQRQRWLKAIDEDGISWVQILNNEEAQKQNLVKDYRVTGYPTKVLVDQNGKIIQRLVGSQLAEELDATLKRIYGY
jgi:thiol-disulfide isomerase/thioredoxin